MLFDARAAVMQIFTPPFRKAPARSVAVTISVLALVWLALDHAVLSYTNVTNAWLSDPWLSNLWLSPLLSWALSAVAGLGLFVGMIFLVVPVTSLVAGFFIAALVVVPVVNLLAPLPQIAKAS